MPLFPGLSGQKKPLISPDHVNNKLHGGYKQGETVGAAQSPMGKHQYASAGHSQRGAASTQQLEKGALTSPPSQRSHSHRLDGVSRIPSYTGAFPVQYNDDTASSCSAATPRSSMHHGSLLELGKGGQRGLNGLPLIRTGRASQPSSPSSMSWNIPTPSVDAPQRAAHMTQYSEYSLSPASTAPPGGGAFKRLQSGCSSTYSYGSHTEPQPAAETGAKNEQLPTAEKMLWVSKWKETNLSDTRGERDARGHLIHADDVLHSSSSNNISTGRLSSSRQSSFRDEKAVDDKREERREERTHMRSERSVMWEEGVAVSGDNQSGVTDDRAAVRDQHTTAYAQHDAAVRHRANARKSLEVSAAQAERVSNRVRTTEPAACSPMSGAGPGYVKVPSGRERYNTNLTNAPSQPVSARSAMTHALSDDLGDQLRSAIANSINIGQSSSPTTRTLPRPRSLSGSETSHVPTPRTSSNSIVFTSQHLSTPRSVHQVERGTCQEASRQAVGSHDAQHSSTRHSTPRSTRSVAVGQCITELNKLVQNLQSSMDISPRTIETYQQLCKSPSSALDLGLQLQDRDRQIAELQAQLLEANAQLSGAQLEIEDLKAQVTAKDFTIQLLEGQVATLNAVTHSANAAAQLHAQVDAFTQSMDSHSRTLKPSRSLKSRSSTGSTNSTGTSHSSHQAAGQKTPQLPDSFTVFTNPVCTFTPDCSPSAGKTQVVMQSDEVLLDDCALQHGQVVRAEVMEGVLEDAPAQGQYEWKDLGEAAKKRMMLEKAYEPSRVNSARRGAADSDAISTASGPTIVIGAPVSERAMSEAGDYMSERLRRSRSGLSTRSVQLNTPSARPSRGAGQVGKAPRTLPHPGYYSTAGMSPMSSPLASAQGERGLHSPLSSMASLPYAPCHHGAMCNSQGVPVCPECQTLAAPLSMLESAPMTHSSLSHGLTPSTTFPIMAGVYIPPTTASPPPFLSSPVPPTPTAPPQRPSISRSVSGISSISDVPTSAGNLTPMTKSSRGGQGSSASPLPTADTPTSASNIPRAPQGPGMPSSVAPQAHTATGAPMGPPGQSMPVSLAGQGMGPVMYTSVPLTMPPPGMPPASMSPLGMSSQGIPATHHGLPPSSIPGPPGLFMPDAMMPGGNPGMSGAVVERLVAQLQHSQQITTTLCSNIGWLQYILEGKAKECHLASVKLHQRGYELQQKEEQLRKLMHTIQEQQGHINSLNSSVTSSQKEVQRLLDEQNAANKDISDLHAIIHTANKLLSTRRSCQSDLILDLMVQVLAPSTRSSAFLDSEEVGPAEDPGGSAALHMDTE